MPAYSGIQGADQIRTGVCDLTGSSKQRTRSRQGFIYVIETECGVKIGWTSDPERRLAHLGRGEDTWLHVWALFPGSVNEERWLHEKFQALRISGEWFRPDAELLDLARTGRLFERPGGLCKFGPSPSAKSLSATSGSADEVPA